MAPIPVTTGFGWTAAGAWGSFAILVGIFIRQIVPWRKQSIDAEQQFRADLLQRVTKLEKKLDRERTRHNAERSLDRHRLNNMTQCFDALILMLKAAPEKAAEIVDHIESMRARQLEAEAVEKAAILAAEIARAKEEGEDENEAERALSADLS